jgi:hypothetical protein
MTAMSILLERIEDKAREEKSKRLLAQADRKLQQIDELLARLQRVANLYRDRLYDRRDPDEH